eukprot:6197544-Pleurochrysis_carterae.AAC.1
MPLSQSLAKSSAMLTTRDSRLCDSDSDDSPLDGDDVSIIDDNYIAGDNDAGSRALANVILVLQSVRENSVYGNVRSFLVGRKLLGKGIKTTASHTNQKSDLRRTKQLVNYHGGPTKPLLKRAELLLTALLVHSERHRARTASAKITEKTVVKRIVRSCAMPINIATHALEPATLTHSHYSCMPFASIITYTSLCAPTSQPSSSRTLETSRDTLP